MIEKKNKLYRLQGNILCLCSWLFFEIYANTKCICQESLSSRYDIEINTKSHILEIKSTRSKFAKGARVIVESAGRNLSVRGQVTDAGLGPRSPSRSRTNLEHTCPVRARETSDLVLRSTMSSHRHRRRFLLRISRSPGGSSLPHIYTQSALRSRFLYTFFVPSPIVLRRCQPARATMPDAR